MADSLLGYMGVTFIRSFGIYVYYIKKELIKMEERC